MKLFSTPTGLALWLICSLTLAQEFGCEVLSVGEALAVSSSGSVHLVGRSLADREAPNDVTTFYARYSSSGEQEVLTYLPKIENVLFNAFAVTPDGTVYLAGGIEAASGGETSGRRDIAVARYDEGKLTWLEQFGSDRDDTASALHISEDGRVYVGGVVEGDLTQPVSGERDQFVAAYSDTGEQLWTEQFSFSVEGVDYPAALTTDADKNIYIAGGFSVNPITRNEPYGLYIYLARFSNDGVMQWRRDLGGSGLSRSHAVNANGDTVILTGDTSGSIDRTAYADRNDDFGSSIDGLIAAYNPNGDTAWIKQFGYGHGYSGEAITRTSDGNVVIASSGNEDIGGPELGARDVTLQLYSPEGEEIWASKLGTSIHDEPRDIATDERNNIYLTGFIDQALNTSFNLLLRPFGCQTFLAKYNSAGQLSWFDIFEVAP